MSDKSTEDTLLQTGSTTDVAPESADGSARPEQLAHDAEQRTPARTSPAATGSWTRLSRIAGLPGVAPLVVGIIAIIAASIGQYIIRPDDRPTINPDLGAATRWYASGIIILLMGWWGTYQNRSLLHYANPARWLPRPTRLRLGLLASSLVACLLSLLILRGDWGSWPGGLLWLGSMLLLVAACRGEISTPTVAGEGASEEGWHLPRQAEIALFSTIMLFALAFRLWRLGDLSVGMHGDEGEVGSDALGIMHGLPAPLFARGWFNQPNMYYWSLVLFMKVFGTGLWGLRSFALFCGLITVGFTYLIGREMFGQRGAIIAGSFMAFQSAGIEFSREEFSNASTPALMAMAFYFALRGLRTRRHLDFVVSGFAAGFSLYYYAGGRLVAPVLAAFFAYLAIVRPRFVKHYWSRVAAFVAGLGLISMPFAAYYIAFPINGLQYPNDRFIWFHHADLAVKYGSADWRVIVWDQLQATVSVITQSMDSSAFGALNFPIARPIEAPLVVLGLAWAAWRFMDSRFFALSLWFWASIFIGGVITIDAPNLPRIMSMLPVLPLVIAAILDHLIVQLSRVVEHIPLRPTLQRRHWVAGTVVACVFIAVGALQNWQAYIESYLNTPQNVVVTAQALYVQQQGPAYRYYGLGAPVVYWTHGDNRFINANADGIDAGNVSEYLPITDDGPSGQKPANFLVWPSDYDYLPVLRSYYPSAVERTVTLGSSQQPLQPLIGVVVPTSQIDSHRTVGARFIDAQGTVIARRQSSLGLSRAQLPPGLKYPVKATWDGSLFADTYGTYRFQILGPIGTQFTIDGVPGIFPVGTASTQTVVLARGLHAIHLSAVIPSPRSTVTVRWATVGAPLTPISQRSLWDDNTVRGWNGIIQSSPAAGQPPAPPVLERRVDGFLGFRNLGQLFGSGPLDGRWSSELTVTKNGTYGFRLNVSGEVSMTVDGHTILHGLAQSGQPQLVDGQASLKKGRHRLEIQIHWTGPFDYLEAYWSPPGQPYQILLSPNVQPQQPSVWQAVPSSSAG